MSDDQILTLILGGGGSAGVGALWFAVYHLEKKLGRKIHWVDRRVVYLEAKDGKPLEHEPKE